MTQPIDQTLPRPPGPQGRRTRNLVRRATAYPEFMEELQAK